MKIYILGICGTFMAGLAMIAREKGYQVAGSDANVYPPMSTQLADAGIRVDEGFQPEQLDQDTDLFIIGNALSRGNAQVEAILDRNLPYTSGAQWLHDHILRDRWVLAVAGTHGKTTTSSMLAWILEDCGYHPGFLIGGLTRNFNISARLGSDPFFVIEADEYDTAFFDKRSKFVHYPARTLILNNLEFDHADIFDNLDAIKRQFHHLLRIVPSSGLVIHNALDNNLNDVLKMGCWTGLKSFGTEQADLQLIPESTQLADRINQQNYQLNLPLSGIFNQLNASAALLAAQHAGIPIDSGLDALTRFDGVKRRQELLAEINGIRIIDDFAHHPTAIEQTLNALKPQTSGSLIAVFEPRSNTMKMGIHEQTLADSFGAADRVLLYDNGQLNWDMEAMVSAQAHRMQSFASTSDIIDSLSQQARPNDQIVIMSNGGFEGLHQRLISALNQ